MDLIEKPFGYMEGQHAHMNPMSSEQPLKNNQEK
jgi:hypothetical protein